MHRLSKIGKHVQLLDSKETFRLKKSINGFNAIFWGQCDKFSIISLPDNEWGNIVFQMSKINGLSEWA